jgi:hypothetical protein
MSAFSTLLFILSVTDGKIKQHVCIKYFLKLGKSTTETLQMLCEAFGEHFLSQTVVFEWDSYFKAGRMSVENGEHSGPPSTGKMTENVAETIGISYGVC